MQPQPATPNQPQMIFDTVPDIIVKYPKFKSGTNQALGAAQIVLGSMCIIFRIAAICIHSESQYFGQGIWSSFAFILTGFLAIHAAKSRLKCAVILTMVFCVVSAVVSIILVITLTTALSKERIDSYSECYTDGHFYKIYTDKMFQDLAARYALNSIATIAAIGEVIIAILQAALCCHTTCFTTGQVELESTPAQQSAPGNRQPHCLVQTNTQGGIQTVVGSQTGSAAPNMTLPPPYAPVQGQIIGLVNPGIRIQAQEMVQSQIEPDNRSEPRNGDVGPPPPYNSICSPPVAEESDTKQDNPPPAHWETFA